MFIVVWILKTFWYVNRSSKC